MSPMAAPEVLVWSNLTARIPPRQQLVSASTLSSSCDSLRVVFVLLTTFSIPAAKFTGYQYGGRPLGITFVKYVTPPSAPADMMDVPPPTGPMTQDQMM